MAYFRAYFRAGKVFQAQLKTDELAQASVDAIPADVKMTDDQKGRSQGDRVHDPDDLQGRWR
jgi:hypothetical protein